jgi:DNA (cytosine-5)-methyltransferase 1
MKVIELFAGAGGLALGLEQAGFETIGLVEIDETASKTLKMNRPNWNVINEDIKTLSELDLEKTFNIAKYELDLLSGGYPCQSFSYAGNRKGIDDTRGTMFYYYAKFLEKLKPKMFLAENVKGLLTHDKGNTLKTMIDVFEKMGYQVEKRVLNAWDFGVAQKRQRIVIVGIREDLVDRTDFYFPIPLKYKPVLRDALKNVPESPGTNYSENRKKVMELVPPGGYWRDLPDDVARDYMKSCYFMGGGRTGIARKISWDEPCLTLTCSPSQKQTDRCHPEENRPFTTREYARIQSFPDEWFFSGTVSNIYKQIGNAVPVSLAKHIGLSIIKSLNEINGGNKMWKLGFITRDDLKKHIKNTIKTYDETIKKYDLKKFNKNIIDPVKLTFDSKVYRKSIEQIIDDEIFRQRDKTNTNAIGYFHQNIFGYIINCEVPKEGFDIIFSGEKKIYVEMKNKHNTMNSSSSQKTYINMQNKIMKEPDCECYLVEVIAKKSQNIEWSISLNKQKVKDSRIRRVSIDRFYEIVTGDNNAFRKICDQLPILIDEIIKENKELSVEKDTVISELFKIDPDIVKSLYLLAFETYEGYKVK